MTRNDMRWAGPALLLIAATTAYASDGPVVERAAVALYVEEREPVGADGSFPADVGELACFSKVAGIEGETHVYHVWIHDSKEYARVKLNVRGPAWRTWSTKRIRPDWNGEWRVEIRSADDQLLETVLFVIEPEDAGGDG